MKKKLTLIIRCIFYTG